MTQTAKYLKVSRRSVNDWVRRFNDEGLDGLKEQDRSGRSSALSHAQLEQLIEYIEANSTKTMEVD